MRFRRVLLLGVCVFLTQFLGCFISPVMHGAQILAPGTVEIMPYASGILRNMNSDGKNKDALVLFGGQIAVSASPYVNWRFGYQRIEQFPGVSIADSLVLFGKRGNALELEPVIALKKDITAFSCSFLLSSADSLFQIAPTFLFTHQFSKNVHIDASQKAIIGFFLEHGPALAFSTNVGLVLRPRELSRFSLVVCGGAMYSIGLIHYTAAIGIPIIIAR